MSDEFNSKQTVTNPLFLCRVVDASAGVSLDRQREIKKTIDVLGDVLESSGQKSIRGSSGS
jgi:hypothetical protein